MNSYRGFSPQQRMKALRWLKGEIAAGRRQAAPIVCDGCGQTEGVLEWHSENYSEPFGAHIGAHGLCFVCHMMVHCRYRNLDRWHEYVVAIGDGYRFGSVPGRSFPTFQGRFLHAKKLPAPIGRRELPIDDLLARIGASPPP